MEGVVAMIFVREDMSNIVSAVMGTQDMRFVAFDANEEAATAFQSFARNIADDTALVEGPDVLDQADKSFAPILLNPG